MSGMMTELRLTLRRLSREPGFTGTAILTMSVGIGAVATVFALVYGVLLRPLPYPAPDRLVAIEHVAPGIDLTRDGLSAGVYLHYRDRNRVFDGIGAYERVAYTVTDAHRPGRVEAALVTPEFFSLIGVTPRIGRVPGHDDHAFDAATRTGTIGALISHDFWVDRYGADPDVLGSAMEINGQPWAVVTGVAPEGFVFPDAEVQAWLVYPQERVAWKHRAEVRHGMVLKGIARLRAGVTVEQAAADLDHLVGLLPEAFPDISREELATYGLRARVRPFREAIVGDVRLALGLVMASACLLLLVTWTNTTNLLLLRTHARRAEIGILRALGAGERDVARRLVSDSVFLAAVAGALGLAMAAVAVRTRLGLSPQQLPRLDEVTVDGVVVAVAGVLALVSGILMGIVCLVSSRRTAGPALAALRSRSATDHPEAQKGRRVLVAAQLALALTLLIGSSLIARTYRELQQVDLGFSPDDRLAFYLPVTHLPLEAGHYEHAALHADVMQALRALPGVDAVEAASIAVFPLLTSESRESLTAVAAPGREAQDEAARPLAEYGYATPGYFREMGIPLLAGRTFRSDDVAPGSLGAILSASLARELFPDIDPLGQTIEFLVFRSFWPSHTVVGVVGDVPAETLREGASRTVYLPHLYPLPPGLTDETIQPYYPSFEKYVVRATDVASLVPAVRNAIAEVDPKLPMLDVATLDAVVAQATSQERFILRLLVASSAAALFLGVVGIYGVLAYAVRRRSAELGIRLALGATPGQVRRLVVAEGALISVAGVAAGLAASIVLTRFIETLLYETSPTDPLTFAGSTLLLLALALAASYLPARRASGLDPAAALRAD